MPRPNPDAMRSWRSLILINIYWLPLALQDAAPLTIAVPADLLRFDPAHHSITYANLVALVALVNAVVPALGGMLSDFLRKRTGSRQPLALGGGVAEDAGVGRVRAQPSPGGHGSMDPTSPCRAPSRGTGA